MTIELIKMIGISTVLLGVFVVLPLVMLLLEHQRKMAKLIRGGRETPSEFLRALGGASADRASLEARIEALEDEVRELRGQSPASPLRT